MSKCAHLADRAVLAVAGEDRVTFLQGLVSNDVDAARPGQAVWAALLTPQGKWLADFFIAADGERLLLDCESRQAAMIAQRLGRYRLRSRVEFEATPLAVYASWGGGVPDGPGLVVADPRLPEVGWRMLATPRLPTNADAASYDRHRLALGLPDGSRDLEAEKTVLLEAGFDELGGVSWSKGCYMGQELTARTRYRGLIKRRLVPVELARGPLPDPGTPVTADGVEVGTLRSGQDRRALATLRLDALERPLTCAGIALRPAGPAWMRLPEAGDR